MIDSNATTQSSIHLISDFSRPRNTSSYMVSAYVVWVRVLGCGRLKGPTHSTQRLVKHRVSESVAIAVSSYDLGRSYETLPSNPNSQPPREEVRQE